MRGCARNIAENAPYQTRRCHLLHKPGENHEGQQQNGDQEQIEFEPLTVKSDDNGQENQRREIGDGGLHQNRLTKAGAEQVALLEHRDNHAQRGRAQDEPHEERARHHPQAGQPISCEQTEHQGPCKQK